MTRRFSMTLRHGCGKVFSFVGKTVCNRLLFIVILLAVGGTAWGQWTEPTPINIQPGSGVMAPWISNDDLRLYFSSTRDLAVMTRIHGDSAWAEWHYLPAHINSTPTQQCPAESPTGDTLYFIGDPRTNCENYGLWDVYFAIRTDTGWGPVLNAGPNVSSNRREFSVGISRDGSILLVASNRLGTFEADLYWHEKQTDGTWGPANHFGTEINDVNWGDEHPCLSPDNNKLFYCRLGPMLNDLRESQKVDGIWQPSVALPSPPNNWQETTYDEHPCLAMDGRTLYFVQARRLTMIYQIMTSVDTSNLAVRPATPLPVAQETTLSVTSDTSGELRLIVSGSFLRGPQQIELYDILGRFVGTHLIEFRTEDRRSVASFPVFSLPSGTYVVSIRLSDITLSAKFLIVE